MSRPPEPTWLETDEYEEAVSALELAVDALGRASTDVYSWKWVVLGLHNALQGFMVVALRDSAGLLPLKDKVAQEWLRAYRAGADPPAEELDTFLNLYKKLKSDRMRFYTHSRPFTPTGNQGRSVKALNRLRNEFIHFVPRSWSLEVSGLPDVCEDCLSVIEHAAWGSGNVIWGDRTATEERAKLALQGMRVGLRKQ